VGICTLKIYVGEMLALRGGNDNIFWYAVKVDVALIISFRFPRNKLNLGNRYFSRKKRCCGAAVLVFLWSYLSHFTTKRIYAGNLYFEYVSRQGNLFKC